MQESITTAKIIVLGDCETGKSCLVGRLAGEPLRMKYLPTWGPEFEVIEALHDGGQTRLLFCDLSGHPIQKNYRDYASLGLDVVLITFDMTNPESLDHVHSWQEQAIKYNKNAKVILVGTKIDLDRQVSDDAIAAVANDLNCPVLVTSAITGEGVQDLAFELVKMANPGKALAMILLRNKNSNDLGAELVDARMTIAEQSKTIEAMAKIIEEKDQIIASLKSVAD